MSRIDDDDETRLYQCARKYEQIVKQFDVLVEMVTTRSRPPKRRRLTASSKASKNAVEHLPSYEVSGNDSEVFVDSITKFLHELRAESAVEADSSSGTSFL